MENGKPHRWKKSWLGAPLGLSQRGDRPQEIEYRIPQNALAPRDGGYLCHHLTKPTKAQGEACMEAFAALNFHFEMKYDTDRHSVDGWQRSRFLQKPIRSAERMFFRTHYLRFLVFDLI